MNLDEKMELDALRNEMEISSLGDRPISISVKKLKRLIELERQELASPFVDDTIPYCWVCKSRHKLVASECRAMDGI